MTHAIKVFKSSIPIVLRRGREVITAESDALDLLARAIDERFDAVCDTVYNTQRQLIISGMGKSDHIARKIVTTFAATGTPAAFLNPSEAAHGGLGNLIAGYVLLVLLNLGQTSKLCAALDYARSIGVPIIAVASQANSLLMARADIGFVLPYMPEAYPFNMAPTTSTTLQLVLGDALAMAVMDLRGIRRASLGAFHPGGTIGLELTPVGELLGDPVSMPLVSEDCSMPEVLSVITQGCVGIAGWLIGAVSLSGRSRMAICAAISCACFIAAQWKLRLPILVPSRVQWQRSTC